jgi:hypothetical protein
MEHLIIEKEGEAFDRYSEVSDISASQRAINWMTSNRYLPSKALPWNLLSIKAIRTVLDLDQRVCTATLRAQSNARLSGDTTSGRPFINCGET